MAKHPSSHKKKAPKSIQQRRTPAQIKKAAEGRVKRAKQEKERVASDTARIKKRKDEKDESRKNTDDAFTKAFKKFVPKLPIKKKKRKK